MLPYLLTTLAIIVAGVVVFFTIATITAYRPAQQEVLHSKLQPQLCLPMQFSVTSWNIGYCGLGKDADFFYDGGKMVRPERKDVEKNLQGIKNFLQARSDDFTLLQEVDTDSKRSYSINELQNIANSIKEYKYFMAYNYRVWFVPIPLPHFMGRVHSGVATFSRCTPYYATRHSYPGREAWPEHLFQLKRCFMACRYTAANGRDLVLINTHNSAFDSGWRRAAELKTLRDFVVKEYEEGNYVVVGGDWNQTPVDFDKHVGTTQYTPHPLAADAMPEEWKWVYDNKTESLRFANEPYTKGKTLTTTVDFFLISPNVKVLDVATHNLGFEHSDHNPVTGRFELQ